MKKAAFICIHNSCRSQMAEAFGKLLASDVLECYSAGTALKSRINPDAVRIMKSVYGIDMELDQRPKLLAEIPPVDIVITMGCDVVCPPFPAQIREDWGLEDPTGQPDEVFIRVAETIRENVLRLRDRMNSK